ncbi:hypothetical protein [Streptomyces sp. NPDC007083]|uniref:hypothetical protein n=1 Tax=Streptomyces sp. NPDC007083 TaxID=3156913 RepID=UPI00340AB8BF
MENGRKIDGTCEGCGSEKVVIAQYGISLRSLGLARRFCMSCLHAELKRLGLCREDSGADELEPVDDARIDRDGDEWSEHD